MSLIKSIKQVLGLGPAAENHFWDGSVPNQLTLKRGTPEAPGATVVEVVDGKVAFPTGSNEIGVGQTWQDVTAGKVSGGALVNSTGKPIMASIRSTSAIGASGAAQIDVAGLIIQRNFTPVITGSSSITVASAIVPAGATYSYTWTGTPTIVELRA